MLFSLLLQWSVSFKNKIEELILTQISNKFSTDLSTLTLME